jgi:KDEL-tailed cysteine endopeptidase
MVTNNIAPESTVSLGLTEFAHLSNDEFRKRNGYKKSTKNEENIETYENNFRLNPESVDWRNKGALTPVKNQGQCGSCWSFSAVETLESREFIIAKQPLKVLSEQELVDCERTGQDHGCQGGEMENAFDWIIKNGIALESDYKYKGANGTCKATTTKKAFTNIKA